MFVRDRKAKCLHCTPSWRGDKEEEEGGRGWYGDGMSKRGGRRRRERRQESGRGNRKIDWTGFGGLYGKGREEGLRWDVRKGNDIPGKGTG